MGAIYRLFFPAAVLAWLTACSFSAPVQEMSNARLAIQQAEAAGARHYSQPQLAESERLLEQAEVWLRQRSYVNARQYALDARDEAIIAREIALNARDGLVNSQN